MNSTRRTPRNTKEGKKWSKIAGIALHVFRFLTQIRVLYDRCKSKLTRVQNQENDLKSNINRVVTNTEKLEEIFKQDKGDKDQLQQQMLKQIKQR